MHHHQGPQAHRSGDGWSWCDNWGGDLSLINHLQWELSGPISAVISESSLRVAGVGESMENEEDDLGIRGGCGTSG